MIRKMYRILIALIAIIFGVFWMIAASSISAPWFFSLFGLVFIAIAAFKIIAASTLCVGQQFF